LGAVRPGRLRTATRLLGLTLLAPACGADFLWVDTMGKMPELVTTTTTASTTTTTVVAPPPPPVVRLPPPPKPQKKPPPPPPPPPPPKAVPLPGDSPLTGIGVGGYATGHPALVVKIDNVGAARPQQGINEADVVFEEMVEGGFTRFAAVFHSTPADPVGPIRSARSTDVALLAPLYHPLFSYSGANRDFQKMIRESSMVDVGVDNFPGKYYRQQGRRAPQNLFSHTSQLHSLASPDAKAPPPLFSYRDAGTRPSEPGARPISRAGAKFFYDGKERTLVSYDWDAGANGWTRVQNGALHVDTEGRKVTPTNVIFQFVNYRNTGYVDSSGAKVPEATVVGNGTAWILSAGYLVEATWEKADHNAVTVFRGTDGKYIRILPGRTWVELIPPPVDKANWLERPVDANDEAKPVAPPLQDGTGPSPPETTTTTTGPEGTTTTTTQPEETTTTTTSPVSTTLPPTTIPDPTGTTTTSTSSTSTSTTTTTTEKSSSKKSQGKSDDDSKAAAAPSTTPASSSASVASGPASAAVIGLLLLVAPWPGQVRRRRRQR
jgi:hypothetical protein